jgi:hypothetical protein
MNLKEVQKITSFHHHRSAKASVQVAVAVAHSRL